MLIGLTGHTQGIGKSIFDRMIAMNHEVVGFSRSCGHDISRNLIRLWVARFEAGAYDDDARAADLIQEYEAKIAALERMVGRQALEIEFLKGALKNAPRRRAATTSVIAGPVAFPSRKDVADGDAAVELL